MFVQVDYNFKPANRHTMASIGDVIVAAQAGDEDELEYILNTGVGVDDLLDEVRAVGGRQASLCTHTLRASLVCLRTVASGHRCT